MATPSPLIRLHADDNVLVARRVIGLGQALPEFGLHMRAQVPAGHKIAACRIGAGEPVRKYNAVIGLAACDIEAGEHVHAHNLALVDFHRNPGFCQDVQPVAYVPEAERASFLGIVRPDGRVARRKLIGIIASVNCSSTAIQRIAAHFTPERLAAFPNVDGVAAFAQTSGCGMSSPSEHFDLLRRTVAGYARHHNLAGVLIFGLGCERNQVADLLSSQHLLAGNSLQTLVMQDSGGTRATIAAGIAAVQSMLPAANAVQRRRVSAAHLKIGLECGGSDGFSGISANPALGAAMDIMVRHGGTAIVSETPEIHGVEYLLTRRAVTPAVGQKLLDRLAWWEAYTRGHNGQFNGVNRWAGASSNRSCARPRATRPRANCSGWATTSSCPDTCASSAEPQHPRTPDRRPDEPTPSQETTMKHPQTFSRRALLLALAGTGLAALAQAQAPADCPNKPITRVVPYPAGGANDAVARLVGQKLAEQLKQQIIIDNRPGAGATLGMTIIAKAPADGYTLALGSLASHAVSPHLYAKPGYDPVADFSPIGMIGLAPIVMIVAKDSPCTSLKSLVDAAKKSPGELTYGSSGNGSPLHLAGELFKQAAQIEVDHIPYKGDSAHTMDLIGGRLDLILDITTSAVPMDQGRQGAGAGGGGAGPAGRLPQPADHC